MPPTILVSLTFPGSFSVEFGKLSTRHMRNLTQREAVGLSKSAAVFVEISCCEGRSSDAEKKSNVHKKKKKSRK